MVLPPARSRTVATVALLVATLLQAGTAIAGAAELTVTGAGHGHQVGLSQYGALGAARAGARHQQILRHYYPGTGLGRRDAGFPIRVGVGLDDGRVTLTARAGPARVRGHARLRRLAAGRSMVVTPTGKGRCRVRSGGHDRVGGCPTLDPAPSARVQVASRSAAGSYGRRGTVRVVADRVGSGWRLDTVVAIPLEQYLYGLAEMPYSWHPQALKAQAIAGRSYALWRMRAVGRTPDRGCSCHVVDSQYDQVYRGREREVGPGWSRWRAAVDDTAGRVVLAPGSAGTQDGIAQTFYSSSSSGRTATNGEVWGGTTRSWLRSVDDPWTRRVSPWVPWTRRVDDGVLRRALRLGRVDRVVVADRTSSGRVAEVRIDGRRGGRPVTERRSGEWLRRSLGLPSTTVRRIEGPGRRGFTDVGGGVHAAGVRWVVAEGVTSGCNPPANSRFCPGRKLTRAQAATWLTRALDLPTGPQRFRDVRPGNGNAPAIGALVRAGVTRGCNPPANTRFCPNANVTRAQMATMLRRALDLQGRRERFADVRGGTPHATSIGAIARAGITDGCNPPRNSRFCPERGISRAEMATMLRRART